MDISLLGALRVQLDGRDVTPSAPKLRNIIALLALQRNRPVAIGSLIDELWGDAAPASALATVQTYVYQLRRMLASKNADGGQRLVTKPLGYELRLDEDELDVEVFGNLVNRAQVSFHQDDPEFALELLTEAFSLCATTPLHDLTPGAVLQPHVDQLSETVLQAMQLRTEVKLSLGHHRELIGELKTLCANNPFNEDLHAKLMICLQRTGRRSDALNVYQTLRNNLTTELGVEPSDNLSELQAKLLNGAPSGASTSGAAHQEPQTFVPAQLPPNIAEFSGRTREVDALTAMLSTTNDEAPTLVAVSGARGVGKKTLATRICQHVREQFPDGQFFASLTDRDGAEVPTAHILGQFLRAAGFADEAVPADLDERAQLFRTWTAGKRVLVLLVDAASHIQVRPLLTSSPGSAVMITGPHTAICGLEGTRLYELDVPPVEDCVTVLAAIAGRDRVEAEPRAAAKVVAYCDQMPLALRVVGARLAATPSRSLSALAERLRDSDARALELRLGDWDLCAAFRSGYELLDDTARTVLQSMIARCEDTVSVRGLVDQHGFDSWSSITTVEQLAKLRFLLPLGDEVDGEFTLGNLPKSVLTRIFETEDRAARSAQKVPAGAR